MTDVINDCKKEFWLKHTQTIIYVIKEDVLLQIVKEMEFHLTGIAKEIDLKRMPDDGFLIDDEFISLKYIREKTMAIKSHLEWLEAEMDEV